MGRLCLTLPAHSHILLMPAMDMLPGDLQVGQCLEALSWNHVLGQLWQVQQSAMVVPMQQMVAQLIHILAEHRASDPDHKVHTEPSHCHLFVTFFAS